MRLNPFFLVVGLFMMGQASAIGRQRLSFNVLNAPSYLIADGEQEAAVVAAMISPTGEPLRGATLTATATVGEIVGVIELSPGLFRIAFRPPIVSSPSTLAVQLVATIENETLRRSVKVNLLPQQYYKISLRVTPIRKDIVRTKPIPVLVTVTPPPLVDLKVTLSTNVGKVSKVIRDKGGRFQASYEPPQEKFPQFAILLATVADSAAVTKLPLAGRTILPLKSEPGSSLRVVVGDRTFGPVIADRLGSVNIPLSVPPGIGQAQVFARDKVGNTTKTMVRLDLPPYPRLVAAPIYGAFRSVTRFVDAVVVAAVDAAGRPIMAASAIGSSFPGATVSRDWQRHTDGTFIAKFKVTADTRSDPSQPLILVLKDRSSKQPSAKFELPLMFPLDLPIRVELSASATELFIGSSDRVRVDACLTDEIGRKVLEGKVQVEATGADIEGEMGKAGCWSGTVGTDTAALVQGRVDIKARAFHPRWHGMTLLTETSIAVMEGKVQIVRLKGLPKDRGGNVLATVQLSFFDREGKPTAPEPVDIMFSAGKIEGEPVLVANREVIIYRTPILATESQRVDVKVRRKGSESILGEDFFVLVKQSRRTELSIRGGYLTNGGEIKAPIGAMELAKGFRHRRWTFLPSLEAAFWRRGTQAQTQDSQAISVALSSLPLVVGMITRYEFGMFNPFGGIGVGFTFASQDVTTPFGVSHNRGTFGGLLVRGGMMFRMTDRWGVTTDFRYSSFQTDRHGLTGNLGGLSGLVGVQWSL